jgi:uncharacterized protein with von Willebrand factor type A (vWA) domain
VTASSPGRVTPDLADVGSLLVVELVCRLRAGGVPISTGEVLDAMRALLHTDLTARSRVRAALRASTRAYRGHGCGEVGHHPPAYLVGLK